MHSQTILNSPNGYYEVGNQIYLNKMEAVYQASLSHQPVRFNFHDTVFSQYDWTKRPVGTLKELYRERAQQIRDRYDYIIIHFSGGQDSWTTLHSFLANGIHVDEVVSRWARVERKYRDADCTNTHDSNFGSEFEFAALPVLEHIKKHYPKIRVTVDDYSADLEKEITEYQVTASNHYQCMGTYFRHNNKTPGEIEAEKHNKSVGIVFGMDKTRCVIQDGNFYAHFSDGLGGADIDPRRRLELFYWTPDFPEIPILQAHCLKDYLLEHFPDQEEASKKGKGQQWREIYMNACYPDYNQDTFQVDKSLGSMIWRSETWMAKHSPRFHASWRWSMKQYIDNISDEYVSKGLAGTNLVTGLTFFKSKYYLVDPQTRVPEFNWSNKRP
jgi:hypothetical protein